jgi:long-chain acyl-CoA synthetase
LSGLGERNLARLAEDRFERLGDHPALWFEGVCHSSGELFDRGTRLGAGLVELGLRPGERVLVMMENSPDVPIAYHAISRAGAVITPVIFLLTTAELRRIVFDCEPRIVITSPAFRETVEAAVEGREASCLVLCSGDELEAVEQAEPSPIVAREDDDLAALVYTGGTTGHSKGVMLTHANLWEAGRSGHAAGYDPEIVRSLSCLPLSHVYGLLVLNVGLHEPEPHEAVLMRWFEAESWLSLAQEHRSQIAPVVPSMLALLLAQPLEEYDLSELRYIASGAAPLSSETLRALTTRLPGVVLREGYGLTESSGLCSTNPPGRVRPGTVGPPVPGTEIRIVDETGAELAAGEPGEICIRSELVMAGYWNDPELTAETLRDGWLHTGDIGRLDEDGYLTIVDRKKDVIIRGGFNVYPRDVEEALVEHPAIRAACVLGRPDPLHGEEVVAFVVLADDSVLAAEDLVAFGKERLGGYKYPREINVLPALPLTPVGKADRTALRKLLTVEGGVR